MSSPALRSIVLAGAGNLGSFIPDELVAHPASFSVTVLTRAGSSKSFPSSVSVKVVDYANETELEEAVKGADVVISTLAMLDAQEHLIRASAKTGVKLFVPSEFGNPTVPITSSDHPILQTKKAAHSLLASVGLPAVLVYTGPFLDHTFEPFFDFDFAGRKVKLVGRGETPISFTSRRDVARFLAHYFANLTTLPSPASPTILRLEGDRTTLKQGAELWARLNGVQLEYEHQPLEEAEKASSNVDWTNVLPSLVAYLLAVWEKGATVDEGKGEEVLSGKDWAEWKPLKLEEFFRQQLKQQ
ncbi:hypothetical protein JCM8547_000751 [Rhodosporidiobolus lusitaniae]